jgi:2-desacetyl-2-hydroxyethyl bacteriochlorophyllide A dehydrogenase
VTRLARAAVVTGPGTIEVRETTLEEPGEDDVVVAISGCGVCGSNAPVWQGRPWFEYPLAPGAPGHEAWGTVEAVGRGVTTLAPGDPVALLTPTAFADVVVAPAHEVVGLPSALAGATFPGEALGCGFNVARRSRFQAGSTVAVVGIGFLGAVVVRLAAAAGAHVIAVARRHDALDVARVMGAAETVVMDDHHRILAEIGELTAGDLCPVVVEATGAQWPLDLAGELTAVGGRLVVAGFHQDGPRSVDMQLWNWRGIDVINAHERDPRVARQGVLDAAASVEAGWFDPSPLYTHQFPLEQAGAALDAMIERPPGFVKALVTT